MAIEEVVIKSVKVPFSSRAIVDEERLLDLLEELRASMPREIAAAQSLLAQHDELLKEATRRAEEIVGEAREMAVQLVNESTLVQAAQAESERLRHEAARDIIQQQAGADRYADEVLAELESKIARALSTIQNGRSQLNTSL